MNGPISAMPLIGKWRFNASKPTLFPFDQQNFSFWHNALTAIWQGAKVLGLNASDRVLIPAYCCGSELDALLKARIQPVFYHVSKQLVPNLDHIEELCRADSPSAILVTNYFGFPLPMQAIRDLATKYNLLIIEDNAHGLFSRNEGGELLGSLGDIGIFSFVKTLPLPDGGGLLLNDPALQQNQITLGQRPDFLPIAGKVKYLFEQQSRARFPIATDRVKRILLDPVIRLVKGGDRDPPEQIAGYSIDSMINIIEMKPERANWAMSGIARFLMHGFDHEYVVRMRRDNYRCLLNCLSVIEGVQPLIAKLPANCCPMFFPLQCEQAPDLQRFLVRQGIHVLYFWSFFHPALPHDIFPTESKLKKTVLALPIHQDLDQGHMNQIIKAVKEWTGK